MENLKEQSNNPLLAFSPLKHHAVEFDKIQADQFLPALDIAIARAKENIEKIKNNSEEPNFQNTILALETSGEDVDMVSTIFYNLHGTEATDAIQALAQEIGPKLSEYSSDITLDEELFVKVKTVFENKNKFSLTAEDLKLLEETYEGFSRNGALLDKSKKDQLRAIDKEMSQVTPKYSENVLKATNQFELFIDKESDLAGLPESAIDAAKTSATEKGEGNKWLFNLQMPSLIPFMKYSSIRELREKMWRASATKACGGEYDNQEQVKKIVQLRNKRAKILGFNTHAEFVLKKRMAESPKKVEAFLDDLIQASKSAALRELEEVKKLALETDKVSDLKPWDISYYIEKLKVKKFDFDTEKLRPYFKLENVIDGVFLHAKKLYGLEFKPSHEYPTYNPDVKTYEVYKEGDNRFIGLFYADFFPRSTKRSGAWMTGFYEQGLFKGEVMRPHVAIVCNFTPSSKSKPSLLTFEEVQTLFHEFGHALHGLLSDCKYKSLGGTNVYWDFVELPSQILENWTLEKEALDLFARHYETNEPIPAEYTEKIKASSQFMAGFNSMRQLNFGVLDMAWHNHKNPETIADVYKFEATATEKTRLFESEPGAIASCSFSHIFAGGYSAGYYSYKWAEVLDADAFEFFKEKGLFNKDVAESFLSNILSKGGTEHPMELYKKFRGREPDPKALLRREGLI